MKKALIAMSGGVDSSVAAYLMKNEGYECIGCTMKLHDETENKVESTCCSESDIEDARRVCNKLGMDYYVFNFMDEFKDKVINKFVNCYLCGLTPNPCIECNEHLKFNKLYEQAKKIGYDYVVTGHYALIKEDENGNFHLLEGPDPIKDQSYVLYRMTQSQLSKTKFPLGDMNKEQTRQIAEDNGFVNANKKDSQDICFVPDGDYASVIENSIGHKLPSGDFVDLNGNVLGQHKGIIHYTVGQRKGLGIAYKEPLYVIRIDVENNKVILGSNEDLFSNKLSANEVSWVQNNIPDKPFKALARVRYHGKKVPCMVYPKEGSFDIEFDEPVRAITKGQAAVIYIDNEVIGGGVIC